MPTQIAMEVERDYTTKLIISNLGHGTYRNQVIRDNCPVDLIYTIDKEMTFYHPVLQEMVSVK